MAYTDIHVNGPAIVQVATSPNGTLTRLGVSRDGVIVREIDKWDDVPTDDAGSFLPGDRQYMGTMARISMVLTRVDTPLLNQVKGRIAGRAGGALLAADIGALGVAGNLYFKLYIESSARTGASAAEAPYTFPCVFFEGDDEVNKGTRYSAQSMSFSAYALNGVLYTRS